MGVANKEKGPKSKWLATLSESLLNRYDRVGICSEGLGSLDILEKS
jgi:hypothetical protein